MQKLKPAPAIVLVLFCALLGCSKKHIVPGVIAGVGGATFAAGTIYRIALPSSDNEGFFGKQPEQKAATASLMFTGLALILVGVIWSATTPNCEHDVDCWRGDACEPKTKTCVSAPPPVPEKTGDGDQAVFLPRPFPVDRFKLNLTAPASPEQRL